jgi:hypothetical protein
MARSSSTFATQPFARLRQRARVWAPGLYVERMVTGGVAELIVGITATRSSGR